MSANNSRPQSRSSSSQQINHRPHSARGSHAQLFLNLQKDRSEIIPVSVREAVAHISERKKQQERQKYDLTVAPTPNNPFSEMMKRDEEKREVQRLEREKAKQEKEIKQAKLWGLQQKTADNHHQAAVVEDVSSSSNGSRQQQPPQNNGVVKRPATAPKRGHQTKSLPYNPLVKRVAITRPTLQQRFEDSVNTTSNNKSDELETSNSNNEEDVMTAARLDTSLNMSGSHNDDENDVQEQDTTNIIKNQSSSATANVVKTPRKPPIPSQRPNSSALRKPSSPVEIADEKTRQIHTEAATFCTSALSKLISRTTASGEQQQHIDEDVFDDDDFNVQSNHPTRPNSAFTAVAMTTGTSPTRSSSRPPSSASCYNNNNNNNNNNKFNNNQQQSKIPSLVTSRPGSSTITRILGRSTPNDHHEKSFNNININNGQYVSARPPPSAPLSEQIQKRNEIDSSIRHHSQLVKENSSDDNNNTTALKNTANLEQSMMKLLKAEAEDFGTNKSSKNTALVDNNDGDDDIVEELFQKSVLQAERPIATETRVRQIHSAGVQRISILSPEQEEKRRRLQIEQEQQENEEMQEQKKKQDSFGYNTHTKYDGYKFSSTPGEEDDEFHQTTSSSKRRLSSSLDSIKVFTPNTVLSNDKTLDARQIASASKRRPSTAKTVSFVHSSNNNNNNNNNFLFFGSSVLDRSQQQQQQQGISNIAENNAEDNEDVSSSLSVKSPVAASSSTSLPPRPNSAAIVSFSASSSSPTSTTEKRRSSPPSSFAASSSTRIRPDDRASSRSPTSYDDNNNNTTPSLAQQEESLLRTANNELAEITNKLLNKTLESRRTYHSLAAWAEGTLSEALGAARNERNETEPEWVEEELKDIPELSAISGPGASSIASTLVVLNSIFTLDPAVSQTWGGTWLTIRNILLSGLFGTDGAYSLQKEMLRGMTRFKMQEEESFARALCAVPSLTEAVQHARTRCAIMKKKISSKEDIIRGLDVALAKHIRTFELKRSFLVFRAWRSWAAKNRWQRYSKAEYSEKSRDTKVLKTIFDAWRRVSITLERIKSEKERDNAKTEAKHAKLILHKAVEDAKASLREEVITAKRHLAEERSLRQAQVSALTMETERLLGQRDDLQMAVEQFSLEGRLWHNLWIEHRPRHYDLFELPTMSTVVAKSITALQRTLSPLFARTISVSQQKTGDVPLIAPQSEGVFEHQQHLQSSDQQRPVTAAENNNNNQHSATPASPATSPPVPLTAQTQSSLSSSKQSLTKFLFDWTNAFLVSADYPRMIISEKDLADGDALFFMLKQLLKSAKQLLRVDNYPRSLLDKIIFAVDNIELHKEPTPGHAVVAMFRIALDVFAVFPFFPPLLQVCPFAGTHFTPAKMLSPEFSEWWQYLLATIFVMFATLPAAIDFVINSTASSSKVFTDASSKLMDQGLRSKILDTMKKNKRRAALSKVLQDRGEYYFLEDDEEEEDEEEQQQEVLGSIQETFASEGLIHLPHHVSKKSTNNNKKRRRTKEEKEEEELNQIADDPKYVNAIQKDVTRVFGAEEDDDVRLDEDFDEEKKLQQRRDGSESPRSLSATDNDDDQQQDKNDLLNNNNSNITPSSKRKNSGNTNNNRRTMSANPLETEEFFGTSSNTTTPPPVSDAMMRERKRNNSRSKSLLLGGSTSLRSGSASVSFRTNSPPLLERSSSPSASSKRNTNTKSPTSQKPKPKGTTTTIKRNTNLSKPTISSALKQNPNSVSPSTNYLNPFDNNNKKGKSSRRDNINLQHFTTLANRGTVPIQCLLGHHHFAHHIEGRPISLSAAQQQQQQYLYKNNNYYSSGADDDTRSQFSRTTRLQKAHSFLSTSSGGFNLMSQSKSTAFGATVPPPAINNHINNSSNHHDTSTTYSGGGGGGASSSSPSSHGKRMSVASSILPAKFVQLQQQYASDQPPSSSINNKSRTGSSSPNKNIKAAKNNNNDILQPPSEAPPPPPHLAHLASATMIRTSPGGRSRVSPPGTERASPNNTNNKHHHHSHSTTYLLKNLIAGGSTGAGANTILTSLGLNQNSSALIANFDNHFETIQKSVEDHQKQWRAVLDKWQTAIKWENLFERDIAGNLLRSLASSNAKKKKVPQTVAEIEEMLQFSKNDVEEDGGEFGSNTKNSSVNNDSATKNNKAKKFGPLNVFPPHHSLAVGDDDSANKSKTAAKNAIHPFYYRFGHEEEDESSKKKKEKTHQNKKSNKTSAAFASSSSSSSDDDESNLHNKLSSASSLNVINERQTAWEQVIRQRAWYSAARLVATAISEFHVLEWLPEQNAFRTVQVCPIIREVIKETVVQRKSMSLGRRKSAASSRKMSGVFRSSLNLNGSISEQMMNDDDTQSINNNTNQDNNKSSTQSPSTLSRVGSAYNNNNRQEGADATQNALFDTFGDANNNSTNNNLMGTGTGASFGNAEISINVSSPGFGLQASETREGFSMTSANNNDDDDQQQQQQQSRPEQSRRTTSSPRTNTNNKNSVLTSLLFNDTILKEMQKP